MMSEKKQENILKRPESLQNSATHYCAGCGHGIVHRLVCEVIDELDIREKVVGVAPVGCAVVAYDYWNFDVSEAPHGRALAVATGIKRSRPDLVVFTYQGDGDLAAIGTGETIHAASRGENVTVVFINNAVYGMTGGQMAPTTLVGQKTLTTTLGRNPQTGDGFPLKISEMLAMLEGVTSVERVSVSSPHNVMRAKKAIHKAFLNQIHQKGFSLVEVLSMCPTIWHMNSIEAVTFVDKEMEKAFPLGVIKG